MYKIDRAAVIGAGTKGLGIAGQLADAGVEVLLLDVPTEGENRNAIGDRALERLLDTAIDAALALSDGYSPLWRSPLKMAGRVAMQEMKDWLQKTHQKGRLTPHDVTTGTQVAMIATGSDVDAGTELSENDICDLEREAFVTFAQTKETKARIEHMLERGSRLRN